MLHVVHSSRFKRETQPALSSASLQCLRRQKALQDFERAALAPGQPVPGHPQGYEHKKVWEDTGYVFTGISGVLLLPDGLKRHLSPTALPMP